MTIVSWPEKLSAMLLGPLVIHVECNPVVCKDGSNFFGRARGFDSAKNKLTCSRAMMSLTRCGAVLSCAFMGAILILRVLEVLTVLRVGLCCIRCRS